MAYFGDTIDETIGILIGVLGYEEAMSQLKKLDREVKNLDSQKVIIDAEKSALGIEKLDLRIKKLKDRIAKLSQGVQTDKVKAELKDLNKELEILTKERKLKIDTASLQAETKKTKAEIKDTKRVINELAPGYKAFLALMADKPINGAKLSLEELENVINALKARLEQLQRQPMSNASMQEMAKVMKNLDSMSAEYKKRMAEANAESGKAASGIRGINNELSRSPVKSWGDQFRTTMRSVASSVKQTGSAMQTFGRTLQSFTSFGGRILDGIFMGFGFRAVGALTSGLSGALERSDTFKTYSKTIQTLMPGLSEEQTSSAIERLNEAVLGLPTGLDEIVDSQKMYTLSMGDFEKATDMAIAANNAFLASNASEEATNTGQRMLNTLMATGKLTAKQWMSLQRTMPAALAAVGREMGYADGEVGKLINDMKSGTVTVDQFTDAFIKVGTGGALKEATDAMKETYSAIIANWQNAIKRLGQGVLDTLSKVLEQTTGQNLYKWLLKIKDGIDAVSKSIQNWIKANPEKIRNLFNSLKSFDWLGLLRGIGQGLTWIVEMFSKLMSNLGKLFGGGAESIGRFLIKGNILGKFITIVGGFVKGTSPLIGAMTALIRHLPIGKFLKVIVSPIGKLFKSLGAIGKTAAAAEKGADAAGAVMKSVSSWQSVAKMGIAVASIPAIAGAIKLLASALKDLDGIEVNWLTKGSKTGILKALGMMATMLGAFGGIATALGALYSIPVIGWIATYAMGKGLVIINAIAVTIKNVTGMLNDIATVEFPSPDKIEELKSRLKQIEPLFDDLVSILNKNGDSAKKVKKKAETALAYADVVNAVTSIGSQMKTLSEMSITTEQIQAAKQTILDIGNALNELSDTVESVFGEKLYNTEGTIESTLTGNGFVGVRFDTQAVQAMADTAQAFADIFGGFEQIINNLNSLNTLINGLVESGALSEDENGLKLGTVKERLDNIATMLSQMLSSDGAFVKLKTVAKYFGNTDLASITQGFNELKNTITSLMNLEADLNALFATGQGIPQGLVIMTRLDQLAQVLNSIRSSFDILVGSGTFMTNAQNANEAVKAIKELVTTLSGIKATLDTGIFEGIGLAVTTLMTNLTMSLANAPILLQQSIVFNAAVTAFKESVDLLIGIAGSDGLAQIPTQLKAIGDALDALSAKMRGIGATWHSELVAGFNAPGVVSEISAALQNIASGIATGGFYSAGYRAGLSFASGVSSAVGAGSVRGSLQRLAMGMTYRARGGSIFKKKGSDTVPAMLTPGEFVMRKRAVSRFGQDFMRRINALDIKGAMASLAMRGGMQIAKSYGKAITNNTVTRDNHAQVTQNIYSNNPNFAYRRANRWVGAL